MRTRLLFIVALMLLVGSLAQAEDPNILNPGFEDTSTTWSTILYVDGGDNAFLDNWEVTQGNVTVMDNTYATPYEGTNCLGLNYNSPGIIKQTVNTEVGQVYKLTFQWGAFDDGYATPPIQMNVRAAGGEKFFDGGTPTISGVSSNKRTMTSAGTCPSTT